MEDHSYNIELVDRYLAGKLDEAELKKFESTMHTDEKLEAYVKELLRAKATTHLAGREAWKKKHSQEFKSSSTNRNRLLIAAIFILLLGISGVVWYQSNTLKSQEELFASQHEFIPAPEMRGEGIDSLLQDAYISYNLKDFPLAIEKFDALLEMDSVPSKDDIYFFKGMALIEMGDLEGAKEVLEEVKGGRFLESAKRFRKSNF